MQTIAVGILRAPDIRVTHHADGTFTLHKVLIGKQFHWQQEEDQTFAGSLRLLPDGDQLIAINDVPLEAYVASVISSEMNAQAPLELLKAHAVISRTWCMAQLQAKPYRPAPAQGLVRWYDHTGHTHFDVCADDHCQRYQGISRLTPSAQAAVEATSGLVLTYDGQLCDTRFSKCCGGTTELFSTCWADVDYPYLQPVPCPFCGQASIDLIRRSLNNYDLPTTDFHDWQVFYTREELSALVARKGQFSIGLLLHLQPLRRGASGRISLLSLVGTEGTVEVGKELEIRRLLSPSHLLSSAFEVEETEDGFLLRGHGWGHGVGLCQIGAAQMAEEGYSYEQILAHYYPGTTLTPLDDA